MVAVYGALVDFDLAPIGHYLSATRTGTHIFMAMDLFSSGRHQHKSDAESFFWVVAYVLSCFGNPHRKCELLNWGTTYSWEHAGKKLAYFNHADF